MVSPFRSRTCLRWAIAGLGGLLAVPAYAEAPPPGPIVRLKPKSVVAPKPLLAVDPTGDGAPVAAVEGARLRQGHRSVAEAAADLPGAHALQVGGPGSAAQLTVRGGNTDQLAVYLGDSPLPNWDGAAFDLADLPLFAFDRLELHRGTVTAELGGQPIGGALRLVPRTARASEFEVRADAGSFGTNGLEAGGSRRAGSWRAYGGGRWQHARGNFSYPLDPGTAFDPSDDRTAIRANNDVQRWGGLAHAEGRLESGATVAATWLGAWLDQGLAGPALLQAKLARYQRQRQVAMVAGRAADAVVAGDGVAWSLAGSWLASAVVDPRGELGPARDDGTRTAGATANVNWNSPPQALGSGNLTVLARVEGGAANVAVRDRRSAGEPAGASRVAGGGQLALRWIASDDATQATPSAGLQWARSAFAAESAGDTTAALPWYAAVALRHSPRPGWTVSGALRRATRLPNLQELFADTGAVAGNPGLQPETAQSADLGATASSDHGNWRWAADVRTFGTRADNLIQLVQVGPHKARWLNVAAAQLWGGEVTLRTAHGTAWQASLQHATLVARDRSGRVQYDGRALPLRPRSKWLAETRWRPPLPGPLTTELWGAWRWQSGYWLDVANEVALPARGLWSTGVEVTTRNGVAAAALRIDNLTDARNFDLVGWPLPGRVVWLTVTWHLSAGGA